MAEGGANGPVTMASIEQLSDNEADWMQLSGCSLRSIRCSLRRAGFKAP